MSENKPIKEPKFEIIGQDHQILQILLYPNDSISMLDGSVIYTSSNIKIKAKSQGFKNFLV
jgi:hypothetical protein